MIKVNYKYVKTSEWIKVRPIVHGMPKKDTWITLGIASLLTNLSTVMIRTLCQNKIVGSFRFRNSKTVLCKLEDIKKWLGN